MHLGQFLKQAGISQAEFGQKLTPPVSQGQVSQWIRGVTAVTLRYSLQIYEVTDHKVTPQDCLEMCATNAPPLAGEQTAELAPRSGTDPTATSDVVIA